MNDHELTVLVEAAASGACNSRVAIHGGVLWEALDPATKNNYREAALPFIFHGAKALADLGYSKPRIIVTVDEMETLLKGDANVVLLDEDGISLQNLVGGWSAASGSKRFMTSDLAHHAYGPVFTVLHEQVEA